MAKQHFLILTHPVEPPTDSQFARINTCIAHFTEKHKQGEARVFPAAGRKGYAIFVVVDEHKDLLRFLYGNSMTFDEDYRVFPLASIDDEIDVLRECKHI
jgi:hypothetical protein